VRNTRASFFVFNDNELFIASFCNDLLPSFLSHIIIISFFHFISFHFIVSHDNAENPLVVVFQEHLAANPKVKAGVEAITATYHANELKAQKEQAAQRAASNTKAKDSIFGMLGGVKLKKTKTTVKNMFKSETDGGGAAKEESNGTMQHKAAQAAIAKKQAENR
jgi:hypothetical protein